VSVSFIIPTFNSEKTLRATIDSTLSERASDQVLVVDDGSSDRTKEIACSYANVVRVLSGPNQGVSAARNRGINETAGKWIIFVDSDDLLANGTVGERLKVAEKTGADVIVSDWGQFEFDVELEKGIISRRSGDWRVFAARGAEIACATTFWAPPAAILYKRDIVNKIGGFRKDLPVIQDARVLFDAAYQGAKIVHAPHLGAYYRVHQNSLSRREPTQFSLDLFKNGEQIEGLWRARGELSNVQRTVLAGLYDFAGRSLFKLGHEDYESAFEKALTIGEKRSRYSKGVIFGSRLLGVSATRMIYSFLGR
jgi:glycosyltransferase involved in cell wall biosynthesis